MSVDFLADMNITGPDVRTRRASTGSIPPEAQPTHSLSLIDRLILLGALSKIPARLASIAKKKTMAQGILNDVRREYKQCKRNQTWVEEVLFMAARTGVPSVEIVWDIQCHHQYRLDLQMTLPIENWQRVKVKIGALEEEQRRLLEMMVDRDIMSDDMTEASARYDRLQLGYLGEVLKDFCGVPG